MRQIGFLCVLALFPAVMALAETGIVDEPDPLVLKIQNELLSLDSGGRVPVVGVPRGEFLHGVVTASKLHPGITHGFDVYIPSEWDGTTPACLLLKLDGFGNQEAVALDEVLRQKEAPPMIAVGVKAGVVSSPVNGAGTVARTDRSAEFDTMSENFSRFVLEELLPAVGRMKTRDGATINLSSNGNDHAVMGGSSGGAGAFTMAWRRPDQFTRVYTFIGSFIDMRGANQYPALIRKTEPKPLRIFIEDGSTDIWDPLFGSLYDANLDMEWSLRFSGYDVAHAWGRHGHVARPGIAILPDVIRWLWRGYPDPIKRGVSSNDLLRQILPANDTWKLIPGEFQSANSLAANPEGVVYVSDNEAATIYRIAGMGESTPFVEHLPGIGGQAFGKDGVLYCTVPGMNKIIAINPDAAVRTLCDGVACRRIAVFRDGTLVAGEPTNGQGIPGRLWSVDASGRKEVLDQGLRAVSGLAFSPNAPLLAVAERSTGAIYSYVRTPDGKLTGRQDYYSLESIESSGNPIPEEIAFDKRGNLYVATASGVQICDATGCVRGILPLPPPSRPVRSLCFGGANFEFLYATDGKHLFFRQLNNQGVAPGGM